MAEDFLRAPDGHGGNAYPAEFAPLGVSATVPLSSAPAVEISPPSLPPHETPTKLAVLNASASEKIALHVGCGPSNPKKLHPVFKKPGWREVRLDIDPRVAPDIVASITDMRVVPEQSVDAVWSSHNLEHLEAHEVPTALREFHRVLKAGGLLLLTLPDLQVVARLIAEDKLEDAMYVSPAGPICPIDTVFGHRASIARGNTFMAHRTGFTAKTLTAKLVAAGFVGVEARTQNFDLWAHGYRSR